ncbi:MAG: hypothetical protein Q6364_14485 [Candidatus Hermodarchaeota archaeon]|nr:hypothetical protein [Candidatus Hermodarchaeota archaeon]
MTEERTSFVARVFDVIFGVISIGLATTVFWLPQSYITLMIILLGPAVFFLGISRIIYGYRENRLPSRLRILNFICGFVLMIFSVLVMISNYLGGIYWILILAIGLMVFGLNTLLTGQLSPVRATWFRIMEIVDGAALVVLGVVVAIFSQLGAIRLLYILAIGIAYAGIYLIIVGIIGRQIFITN